MGLPGAGKTTLAKLVAARLNAAHFNADEVRDNISKDLGFSLEDRIEHATRMGWLCDRVVETGGYAVANFICPTVATRAAFFAGGKGIIVWVNRLSAGRFEDTNQMFETPGADLIVKSAGTPEFWCEQVVAMVRPVFNWRKVTALFVGRYQPFHNGHKRLVEHGIERLGQACVAVRSMPLSDANPFGFEAVRARIENALSEHQGRFVVVQLPNISAIMYGRDVGYAIEEVDLGPEFTGISGTEARAKLTGASSLTATRG